MSNVSGVAGNLMSYCTYHKPPRKMAFLPPINSL
jgi:hypothetical protein